MLRKNWKTHVHTSREHIFGVWRIKNAKDADCQRSSVLDTPSSDFIFSPITYLDMKYLFVDIMNMMDLNLKGRKPLLKNIIYIST